MAIKKDLPLGEGKKRLSLGNENEDPQVNERSVDLFTAGNDHADGDLQAVGDRLRLQREAKGYTLQGMADLIRLRPRQIQALEDGDYGSLPGQAFVVGFLKSYANALGLDATEVVAQYRNEEAGQLGAPQLAFPQPTSEGRKPGSHILIGTCIAAMLAVGGWYFYLNDNKVSLELVPDLPRQLAEKIATKTTEIAASTEKTPSTSESKKENTTISSLDLSGTVASGERDSAQSRAVSDPQKALIKDETNVKKDNEEETSKAEIPIAETPKELLEDKPVEPALSLEKKLGTSDAPSVVLLEADKKAEGQSIKEITPPVKTNSETISVSSDVPADSLSATIVEEKTAKLTDVSGANVSIETIDKVKSNEKQGAFPQEKLGQVEKPDAPDKAERVPEALGVQNTNARIVLMAQQDVWVQIIAAGNEVVLERVLGAGDTYMLPDLTDLRLNTANAAGLEFRLDGEILGSVGTYGGIVRDLDLNPIALKKRFPAAQ